VIATAFGVAAWVLTQKAAVDAVRAGDAPPLGDGHGADPLLRRARAVPFGARPCIHTRVRQTSRF
jgi:hypothetical protein